MNWAACAQASALLTNQIAPDRRALAPSTYAASAPRIDGNRWQAVPRRPISTDIPRTTGSSDALKMGSAITFRGVFHLMGPKAHKENLSTFVDANFVGDEPPGQSLSLAHT